MGYLIQFYHLEDGGEYPKKVNVCFNCAIKAALRNESIFQESLDEKHFMLCDSKEHSKPIEINENVQTPQKSIS